MSLPDDLIRHAIELLPGQEAVESTHLFDIRLRRAVSATYYALFHTLTGYASTLLAPNVSSAVNHRIRRWFEHAEMKKICGRFIKIPLEAPLLNLVGSSVSADLHFVASAFIDLQDLRHSADYDLGYQLQWQEARLAVEVAVRPIGAWTRIKHSAEANIFVLSLLMFKNWDKER